MGKAFHVRQFDHTPRQDARGSFYLVRIASKTDPRDAGYWDRYRPATGMLDVATAGYLAREAGDKLLEATR